MYIRKNKLKCKFKNKIQKNVKYLYEVYIGGTIMYEIIANLLNKSKKTVIITGNGINIGLSNIENIRKIDNQTYNEVLKKDDNKFIKYYRDMFKTISLNKPNKAHNIIEKWKNKNIIDLIITQNIDGYHGVKNVIELHGNIDNFYCIHLQFPCMFLTPSLRSQCVVRTQ